MCKKTKASEKDEKKDSEKEEANSDKGNYYYDDAHGYEVYDLEKDEENDENK